MTPENRLLRWRSRFPRVVDLERRAERRVPSFAFDFVQGGTADELSRPRNLRALRNIEIVSRCGADVTAVDPSVRLFGRNYAAPLVIAPVGMDGAIWPGATRLLAGTAKASGLPYMAGTLATASLEAVARIAPDQVWFQLYTFPDDDHRVTFDLVRRAKEAGAHVLAVTLDIPVEPRRVRDMRNGLSLPLHPGMRMAFAVLRRPYWLAALARSGSIRMENMAPYCPDGAGESEIAAFVRNGQAGSGATWDLVARIRDAWKGALVVKGIQHPADAETAASLGLDGVVVSNHGGRQFDPSPASIDLVPAIRAASGTMSVLMDGGIMSGNDILKAIACGADAVLAGRAFMLGLAALGDDGARHVAETLKDEFRIALAQTGALNAAGIADLVVRHGNAWKADDFTATRLLQVFKSQVKQGRQA